MPELKQLRVLRTVAQAGSFSAAADELDYTQPAVSRIVAALERELGTVLIDRQIRPLRPTDAGRAVIRHAERMFEELVSAQAEVEAIAQLESGTLRVGTFSSAGAAFVVRALQQMRRQHRGVELSVTEAGPPALVQAVRAGELDLATVFDFPQVGEDIGNGLELHPLLDDPLTLVIPRHHRLAGAEAVSFADLADENWLLPDFGPDSPSLRLIDRGCAVAGFQPRVVFRVNDCPMTQAMVAAGEGIAMLPSLMLRPTNPGVRVKPMRDHVPVRRISAVRLRTRHFPPASQAFLAMLRKAAKAAEDRSSVGAPR
jgi:DNA-binding transcriptional LysR family regulator